VIRADTALGEVVDYSRMKVVVPVDELDISQVEVGQQAEVLVEALPDRVFSGVVTEIADEGTQTSGVATFDVTILLDEADGLKAGMSAEAAIVTMKKENALYVPIDAVQSVRGQYFVLVPGEEEDQPSEDAASSGEGRDRMRMGRQPGTRRVEVRVGVHNEDYVEILSGLSEGDQVIVLSAASGGTRQNEPSSDAGGFEGAGLGGFGPGGGGGFPGGGFPGGGGGPGGGGFSGGGAGGAARGGGG
jgi:HlyD family secretion protein